LKPGLAIGYDLWSKVVVCFALSEPKLELLLYLYFIAEFEVTVLKLFWISCCYSRCTKV